jgi:hypothetical protein
VVVPAVTSATQAELVGRKLLSESFVRVVVNREVSAMPSIDLAVVSGLAESARCGRNSSGWTRLVSSNYGFGGHRPFRASARSAASARAVAREVVIAAEAVDRQGAEGSNLVR